MLDTITSYVLAITPAVASVVAMISAVVTLVKKIRSITGSTNEKITKIEVAVNSVLLENASLKKENRQLKNYLKRVMVKKDEEIE